jgi:hypothetical protein
VTYDAAQCGQPPRWLISIADPWRHGLIPVTGGHRHECRLEDGHLQQVQVTLAAEQRVELSSTVASASVTEVGMNVLVVEARGERVLVGGSPARSGVAS